MKAALAFAALALSVSALAEKSPVSAKASLAARSAFVNYGLVMGRDPIVVPSGRVSFFDWVYVDSFAIMDTTAGNGKRGCYGNRAGEYRKLNTSIGVRHGMPIDGYGVLYADLSYMYEYVPRYRGAVNDTQFIHLKLAFEGQWLEPHLHIERDFMLDDGTYAAFEVGHTFRPFDRFTVRPSVGQGFGDSKRAAGCFGDFDSAGLMDSTVKVDFGYALTEWLTIGAYVAYHDFLFGDSMRSAAARFNERLGYDGRTWNFSAGIGVSATF